MMSLEESLHSVMAILIMLTMFTFSKNHVMNNLIIIEFIIISIATMMFVMINMMTMENYLIMYFLITAISESILGLSILISMIRTHGNDHLKSLMVMKL